jgi:cell division septum initiation protein DivIVA
MNDPPTKDEEIQAVWRIADELGPKSYLGPWLKDALPFLAASITSDMAPVPAQQMHQQATVDRVEGLACKQQAQIEARELLDSARQKADGLIHQAKADAERITSRAWQAIRLATKELEY